MTLLTLVVNYKDGTKLQVPYFDPDGAKNFLNKQKNIDRTEIISFTGGE